MADHVAAFDRGALGAGRDSSATRWPHAGGLDGLAVHLQAAHAKKLIAGQAAHVIADLDLAAERRSGDHDAMPLQDEGAVDGQAKVTARRGLVGALQMFGDAGVLELVDALAGDRRDGDHRRSLPAPCRG